MSIRTLIQAFILLLILFIIGWVYLEYFNTEKKIVEEIIPSKTDISQLEKKIYDLEIQNKELEETIKNNSTSSIKTSDQKIIKEIKKKSNLNEKKDLKNNNKVKNKSNVKEKDRKQIKKVSDLMKDVEYTSIDQKGNKFHLLATSGKSNENNKDILDLENVRGKITSDIRDTIYIVSDYGQYNSINLNSKFYENVIINYQNKQITCINFDINMETNKAIAYNDVIITDPKSVMKAGIVEFDLKTRDVVINPASTIEEVEVVTN
tara:strand:- start:44 stop:832 length:789 start_codon:yes stop_codon:yes gene_type:complete